ncbi:MAG TPA: DUF192 domain-containing protein [Nevskiaceae bacterium]|nr:DUF192 domain-containing protein [Nevskiaceae bacterium]
MAAARRSAPDVHTGALIVTHDGMPRGCLHVVYFTGPILATRGLLARHCPPPGYGVVIHGWPSLIHTLGMAYPIDVLWLDRHRTVVAVATVPAWRPFAWGGLTACDVIEMRAGEADRVGIDVGDTLRLAAPPRLPRNMVQRPRVPAT